MSFHARPASDCIPSPAARSWTANFHTNIPGIFAAGNVVHVYDLVDWVTEAGYAAGKGAALFAQ